MNLSLQEYGFYRFRETLETINKGDENFFHSSVFQLCDNLKPELGPFIFGSQHSINFFDAFQIDCDGEVDNLVGDPAVVVHLDPDRIKIDDRIDLVQGSVLPKRYLFAVLLPDGAFFA